MAIAIDANVLIYASKPGCPQHNDCRRVIFTSDDVRIPAIAVVEALAFAPEQDAKALRALLSRMTVIPLDGRGALLASGLIKKLIDSGDVCGHCLNNKSGTACKDCGRPRSRGKQIGDFLVAVSAANDPDVTHLYTYDERKGLKLELAATLNVECPPNADGPMFEKAREDAKRQNESD